jgi:hypothetical protein
MSDDTSAGRPRCKFLSCKAMMVFGEDFESDPDFQAGAAEFWCECTCQGQGPDGDGVSLELCSDPDRACHQEY